MFKKFIALAAIPAVALGIAAGSASAASNPGLHDGNMADAIPSVWSPATGYPSYNYYWSNISADVTSSTTTNSQWVIKTDTMVLTVNDGTYGGWKTTFTFQQKTPVAPVQNRQASSTGTVTDVTPYGTSSESFTAPVGTVAPWSVGPATDLSPNGNVQWDPFNIAAKVIGDTQHDIVYVQGGQNTVLFMPYFGA
jgi:hypothetical protein